MIHMWKLHHYSTLVYLHIDSILTQNMDDLFLNTNSALLMAPPPFQPICTTTTPSNTLSQQIQSYELDTFDSTTNFLRSPSTFFQSHLLVITPNHHIYEKFYAVIEKSYTYDHTPSIMSSTTELSNNWIGTNILMDESELELKEIWNSIFKSSCSNKKRHMANNRCWQSLSLNYSLSEYNCPCMSISSEFHIWNKMLPTICTHLQHPATFLSTSPIHHLTRVEQLTIHSHELFKSNNVHTSNNPTTTSSTTRTHSHNKLLFQSKHLDYSHLNTYIHELYDTEDEHKARQYAMIYLNDQKKQSMDIMKHYMEQQLSSKKIQSTSLLHPSTVSPSSPAYLSCCSTLYTKWMETYFQALEYLRPST